MKLRSSAVTFWGAILLAALLHQSLGARPHETSGDKHDSVESSHAKKNAHGQSSCKKASAKLESTHHLESDYSNDHKIGHDDHFEDDDDEQLPHYHNSRPKTALRAGSDPHESLLQWRVLPTVPPQIKNMQWSTIRYNHVNKSLIPFDGIFEFDVPKWLGGVFQFSERDYLFLGTFIMHLDNQVMTIHKRDLESQELEFYWFWFNDHSPFNGQKVSFSSDRAYKVADDQYNPFVQTRILLRAGVKNSWILNTTKPWERPNWETNLYETHAQEFCYSLFFHTTNMTKYRDPQKEMGWLAYHWRQINPFSPHSTWNDAPIKNNKRSRTKRQEYIFDWALREKLARPKYRPFNLYGFSVQRISGYTKALGAMDKLRSEDRKLDFFCNNRDQNGWPVICGRAQRLTWLMIRDPSVNDKKCRNYGYGVRAAFMYWHTRLTKNDAGWKR